MPGWTISAPVRPDSWRPDGGVLQLDLGVLDRGAVGGDRRVERGGGGERLIELVARGDPALGEVLVALGLGAGVGRLRRIAVEVGLRPTCSAASSGRRSSVNSTCPSFTSSPSLKFTDVSSPVICACTDTVENGSPEPIVSISTGIGFWTTAVAVIGAGPPPAPRPPRPPGAGAC